MCIFLHLSFVNAAEKIKIVVSIPPQTYFVKQIGGNFVDIMCLLPEGKTPHFYEPKPQQMKFLSRADMYVRIKVDYENAWWDKIIATNSDMLIVDSTHNIEFIEEPAKHHDSRYLSKKVPSQVKLDPHIWLSPQMVKSQVEHIYQGLITIDPEHLDVYKENKKALIQSLDILDNEIREKLADTTFHHFMVYHPVWSYFAKDYNLEQIPIEIDGKEPSAKEMLELMKIAKKKHITVILLQPQANQRIANIIAKQIGAKVEIINPLAPQWLKNMRYVMDVFVATLSRK